MKLTRDAVVKEVRQDGKRQGKALVEVDIGPSFEEYVGGKKEIYPHFNTRSRLAKVFFFAWLPEKKKPKLTLKGGRAYLSSWIEYQSRVLTINLRPGDEIGRFSYSLDEEILRGDELESFVGRYAEKLGSSRTNKDGTIGLKINPRKRGFIGFGDKEVLAKDLLASKESYRDFCSESDSGFSDNTLFETKESITMPDGYYGVIVGNTMGGYTYHGNSRIVDPGFSGRLILELQTREEPAELDENNWYVNLLIYKKT